MSAKANVSQWSISGDFGDPQPTPGSRGRQHGMIDRNTPRQAPVGIVPGASPSPAPQHQGAAGTASTRGNVGHGDIISHTQRSSSGTLQPRGGHHRESPVAASQRGGYPDMQQSPPRGAHQEPPPQYQHQLPPRHSNHPPRPEQYPNQAREQNHYPRNEDFDFSRYSSRQVEGPPPVQQAHHMPSLQVPPPDQYAVPRYNDGMSSNYSHSVASSVREDVYEQKRNMYLSGRRLQPPPSLPGTPHGQGLPPRPVQPPQQEHPPQRSSNLGNNGREASATNRSNDHFEGVKSGRRRTETWEKRREEFLRRKRRESSSQQSSRPISGGSGGQYDEERVPHGRRAGIPRGDSLRSLGSGQQEMPSTPAGQPMAPNRAQQHPASSVGQSSARSRGTASSRGRPPGGASSIQLG